MNFWTKLPKPFFALAPMADVTDAAFRRVVAKYSRHGEVGGGPDVFWTEFVSADGLASGGREALLHDLAYTEGERPIVAQLFSSKPENMRTVAKLCAELGFDGIDINMGCPDKSIEKQGCGAAMMKTPELAREIIRAAKQGIKDAGKNIPLSVKTRVGYYKVEIDTWIPVLLEEGIDALTIHARTRKEMSKVPADWSRVKAVVALRDKMKASTLIIGNGDITDIEDGKQKAKETGCDGIMIGRAIFGNPWLFDTHRNVVSKPKSYERMLGYILPSKWLKKVLGDRRYTRMDVTDKERLDVLVEHATLFESLLGKVKHFAIMKKHFKAYVHGFPGSKELRIRLMDEGNNASEVKRIVKEFHFK